MMCLIQKAEYEIFLIMETIQFMYEKMNKLVRDNTQYNRATRG